MMLIGSWCMPFYKAYFSGIDYSPVIKTRDMDFLVPAPGNISGQADIPALLKDLGFIVSYVGEKGYIQLKHPDLLVEFLSPEKGRGTDEPVKIQRLGVNAVALRYLDLLIDGRMNISIKGFTVSMPHPVNFALHKLIIFQRRVKKFKADKDREAALMILRALVRKGDVSRIKSVFGALIPAWKKSILKGLQNPEDREILNLLIQE
jgi:hypothetical protein